MKHWQPTLLALALMAAFPTLSSAQTKPATPKASSSDAVLKELRALQDRVGTLEKQLKEAEAKAATAAKAPAVMAAPVATTPQWGMTPDQVGEFNRIAVKTESLEDNIETWGIKGLTVSGYIEPVFIWNQRQDRAGVQFLNQQSDGFYYDTSFMGAASISFAKETDSGTLWKLTLNPNRGVGAAMDGSSIVQEASVSIPLTDLQTRLIVGQIPDWSGYEYQPPTQNSFTTHNLLFDFTLPVGYTGVGLDITRGKWWMRGIVGNVNQTIKSSGDKQPMVAYRVDYSKGEFDGFGFAGLHGRSPNFNTGTNTSSDLFEVDGYYNRGDWTLQGQLSYGRQKQGSITPIDNGDGTVSFRDSEWYGVSGLVGYAVTPRLQALVRADYIQNDKNGGGLYGYNGYSGVDESGSVFFGNDGRNGIGPDLDGDLDKGANRYAITFGLKYAFNQNTTFKAEYRYDGASEAVFEDIKDGGYRKSNNLFGASVVVFF